MFTNAHQKIAASHLERDAYLYIRQSSLRQVLENQESTKRQYALRERAVALGWPIERIQVIDSDLGLSGAQGAGRDGFARLVSEVAMGHVGIVLGLEVSRLARNNADWHRLLELSAMAGTLILDEDGVYDPTHFNDRLLLGLKGAMSEAELHVLKARLQGGIRHKAQRGELQVPLPIGLVYRSDQSVDLDPDQSIRQSLQWLFETFDRLRSAMAVVKRFQVEGLQFPRRIRRGIGKGDVLWGKLEHSRVLQILHNPRYAGAFVYGRTCSKRTCSLQRATTLKVDREHWQVLIPDAHVGYISWTDFERNQQILKCNAGAFAQGRRGSVPREGNALLQRRVICGKCGERMRVRYQQLGQARRPYYQCTHAAVRHAGKLCQSIAGYCIDEAIAKMLLETVSTPALEAALEVQKEVIRRVEEAEKRRATQLEQQRYQAELARRRYIKVDPDNRLVADTLEADWNEQLRQLDQLQQAHDRQRQTDHKLLTDEVRERIIALAKDFPRVWNDQRITAVERKRIVALLIEDVTLNKGSMVAVHVRFRGGKVHAFEVPRPLPMSRIRKTSPEVVNALDQLLETCTDQQAAEVLNRQGYRNWKGDRFTVKKVSLVRHTYGLKSRYERLRERGYLTGSEMGQRLGVSTTTIHTWARAGLLQREPWGNGVKCLYAPQPHVKIKKGRGGPGAKAPTVINVPASAQETV